MHCDYIKGQIIAEGNPSMNAVIQAAMRRAVDLKASAELWYLRQVWPEAWQELQSRLAAVDGVLPGDYPDEGEGPERGEE